MVFKGEVDPRPIARYLAILHRHIKFDHLGHSQVFEGLRRHLYRILRGILPRGLAGTYQFDNVIHAAFHNDLPFVKFDGFDVKPS